MKNISLLTELLGKMEVIELSHKLEEHMPIWPTHSRFYKTLWHSYLHGDAATDHQLLINEHHTVYAGPDEKEKGRRWAEWLSSKLDGKGNIVVLGGMPGNPDTAAALEGAREVFQKSDITVCAYRDAYWQEDRAKEIMLDLINTYDQIDGVWSDGGQVATGALKALLAANRPLVPITGDDYNGLLKMYMTYHQQYPKFEFAVISSPTWQSKNCFANSDKIDKW